jgi:hypothetical protein
MSALESLPLEMQNRRRAERLRVAGSIAVIFGRGEGVLIDLSQRGARIRHHSPARRGSTVRISFEWERVRFSANAEVLASRIVSLGEGPSYESRVRFTSLDAGSDVALAQALEGIAERDMRRWVANMRGWSEDAKLNTPLVPSTRSYIRCRLHGAWWERKVTSDATQPADGFSLPAESSENEIQSLCDTYSRGSDEERHMIRLMAAAAVEHSLVR